MKLQILKAKLEGRKQALEEDFDVLWDDKEALAKRHKESHIKTINEVISIL